MALGITLVFLGFRTLWDSSFFFTGTRESAFVYALAAAAVSHSIARACASGELPICSCGSVPSEVPGPGFRWGGCGDNLRYGLQMGSAFADGPMKSSKAGGQATRLMNLHNNAVGRQVGMVTGHKNWQDSHNQGTSFKK